MTKFAFISHSSDDKPAADAACAALETAGVRCWIAPRDIQPGSDWGASIINALDHCQVLVLIFSLSTNGSRQIRREIAHAVNKGVPIIPFRIEDAAPTEALAYFTGGVHWLDALTPPMEQHLQRLVLTVKALLIADQAKTGETGSSEQIRAFTREAATATELNPESGISHAELKRSERGIVRWFALNSRSSWVASGTLALLIVVGAGAWSFLPATKPFIEAFKEPIQDKVEINEQCKTLPKLHSQINDLKLKMNSVSPDNKPEWCPLGRQLVEFDNEMITIFMLKGNCGVKDNLTDRLKKSTEILLKSVSLLCD